MFQTSIAPEHRRDTQYRFASRTPAALGVGLRFTPALSGFVHRHLAAIDHLSIVPEAFWPDADPIGIEHATEIRGALHVLDAVAARRPLIAHGTGLFIGDRAPLDLGHLDRIADWHARYDFRWYSDQLVLADDVAASARRVSNAPIPYDHHALKRVVERVRAVQARLPIPLLLENNVHAHGVPQQEMSEPMLLNRLCAATGCALVLDLRNLHASALACGIDALSFLERLDLTRVVEIHVAAGVHDVERRSKARTPHRAAPSDTDALPAGGCVQTSPCPPPLLEVLEATMWRAPKLRAVTIEVDSAALASDGDVLRAIEAAKRIWTFYH